MTSYPKIEIVINKYDLFAGQQTLIVIKTKSTVSQRALATKRSLSSRHPKVNEQILSGFEQAKFGIFSSKHDINLYQFDLI